MQTIEQALDKLEKSKFRSSFHLTKKEREYLEEKGMETIRRHTEDFVRIKLSPAHPLNDGKQTPCTDTRHSRACIQQPAAAEDAWRSGTKYRRVKN